MRAEPCSDRARASPKPLSGAQPAKTHHIREGRKGNLLREFIRVTNFDKYQLYNDGRPLRWIKLHLSLLDDYDFCQLPDHLKWPFVGLLLLAAKHHNEIPADPKFITTKLSVMKTIDLDRLVDCRMISYETVRESNGDQVENVHRVEKKREEEKRVDKFVATDSTESSPLACTLILAGGEDYPIYDSMIAEWKPLYPGVNVQDELRNMKAWLLANVTNRKTKRGMTRFINYWLSKRQNQPRAKGAPKKVRIPL